MIITFLIAKIILGGYWLMLAPVLFLPLGIVLLSSQVRRGLFAYVVLPLAVVFAALGMIFLFTLTLSDAVTVLAGVQAMWLLAAAITLVARNEKQRGSQSQELRTAKSSITRFLAVALTFACLGSGIAQAEELTAQQPSAAENNSATEASKQAANPLASVWLMQFQQNNTSLGMPANGGNRVQSNLQFQPLMSVRLTDDWSLVTRPVLQLFNTTPFQDQGGQANRMTAFGDTAVTLALSPGHRLVGNWLLAAGPTFIFPTATDSRIGQNKWQVGPAAAVGYTGKDFVTYVFPQQWFSVGGDGRRTRQMSLIYAFVRTLPNGWTVGTNPNMSVDWEASSGNKVSFPVGLQVGKLRKLGPMPVKFDLQFQYYAVRPQVYGPKWNLQLQITPILPALIGRK